MEFSTCEGAEGVLEVRILRWAFDTELVSLSPPPFASLISLFLQNCVGDAMQNARQRATVLAGTSNASTLLSSLRSNPTPQRYSHTYWPSIAPRLEYQRLRNRHESPLQYSAEPRSPDSSSLSSSRGSSTLSRPPPLSSSSMGCKGPSEGSHAGGRCM
jgi:hypothetical protein